MFCCFQITNGQCQQTHECTFDYGLCGWTQDDADDLDWTLNAYSTSSVQTGPQMDHTDSSGTGKYAYIEASGTSKLSAEPSTFFEHSVISHIPIYLSRWLSRKLC